MTKRKPPWALQFGPNGTLINKGSHEPNLMFCLKYNGSFQFNLFITANWIGGGRNGSHSHHADLPTPDFLNLLLWVRESVLLSRQNTVLWDALVHSFTSQQL